MSWALAVYIAAAVFTAAAMIGISYFLGQRHRARAMLEPYESGIIPTESARLRFDIRYYLVAMIFLVFDMETIFIITWAIAFRHLGLAAYISMVIFIAVLLIALLYIARRGAFDFARPRSTPKTEE
jgi:NADH-quinone oxidoreductase subunit A